MFKEVTSYNFTRDLLADKTKIVELIGPPGIGKSTIYKALCQSKKNHVKWITQAGLLQTEKPKIRNTKKWVEYHLRSLLNKREEQRPSMDHGLLFAEKNADLAAFLWKHLSASDLYDETPIGLRFRASSLLFKDFCRYQQIQATECKLPCLIEEGFLQKSFLIPHHQSGDEKMIREYLSLLPRPQAIIYVNTNDNRIILDRLIHRQKVIASHKGKDADALRKDIESWQQLYRMMLRIARQEYKIPVFYLNGSETVQENVNTVKQIMDRLSHVL